MNLGKLATDDPAAVLKHWLRNEQLAPALRTAIEWLLRDREVTERAHEQVQRALKDQHAMSVGAMAHEALTSVQALERALAAGSHVDELASESNGADPAHEASAAELAVQALGAAIDGALEHAEPATVNGATVIVLPHDTWLSIYAARKALP